MATPELVHFVNSRQTAGSRFLFNLNLGQNAVFDSSLFYYPTIIFITCLNDPYLRLVRDQILVRDCFRAHNILDFSLILVTRVYTEYKRRSHKPET